MFDVEHYLSIYKFRKKMMEEGIINPMPEGGALIIEIVFKLSKTGKATLPRLGLSL